MGKPKSKSKKSIEENEFLRDLINEVKAIDISDDDSSDTELSGQFNILTPGTKTEHVHGFISGSDTSAESAEELPTVFAHIRKDIKAPDLKDPSSEAEVQSSAQSRSADNTVASQDSTQQNATALAGNQNSTVVASEPDRTIAVEGARNRKAVSHDRGTHGAFKPTRPAQVYTNLDASLVQAETLKIAQGRIKELEGEIDRLRQENDDLASAGDIVTKKLEEVQIKAQRLEKEKADLAEQSKSEILILKGNLQYKQNELSKTKAKLEDLESRIKTDFRKIRVRERELENRLELVRGEKQALMRAKDEKILDLQRKLDQYKSELDLYRVKVQDLNKLMETQQDQMQKTIRALRVALVNLEHEDSAEMTSTESAGAGPDSSDSDSQE
jgi:chromosome segregation ATPase